MSKVDKLRVFLNQGIIDYVIMNGYEELEVDTSDIDIIVPDIYSLDKKLKKLAEKFGYSLVQRMEHHAFAINYFIWDAENSEFISLDLYSKYIIKNKELFSFKEFNNKANEYDGFKIPSTEIEFTYYWFKKIIKKDLSEKNYLRLKLLFEKDSATIISTVKSYAKNININADVFSSYDAYFDFSKKLKPTSYFPNSKGLGLKELKRKVTRVLKPTGLTISFLGPDGSGKSTIIDELNTYALPFRKRQYFHLLPVIQKSSSTNSDPHGKPPYNFIVSMVKLFFLLFKYWKGHLKLVKKMKIKSTFVIFDRYFDDLIVDPKRFRYGAPMIFARLIKTLIPKPDLTIVLTGDPVIIQARKNEVDVDTCKNQIDRYNNLKGKNYHHIQVDKNLPNEIVKEIINKALVPRLSQKIN